MPSQRSTTLRRQTLVKTVSNELGEWARGYIGGKGSRRMENLVELRTMYELWKEGQNWRVVDGESVC